MTRVIAGTAGGRRLAVPPGTGTRPTSDRAREGLFSTWQSLLGGPLDGERVLDLYAGSGAVGLEALSRGAGHTLLVEADARAARVVRDNVRNLGLPGAEVRAGKAEQIIRTPPRSRTTWSFSTRRTPCPTTIFGRFSSHSALRAGSLSKRSSPWSAAPEAGSSAGRTASRPSGPVATARERFWYGRAASTCEDAR
ncbi:16S rRNA (guanine(966)-N(2))-methyltransferase RsmD [Streptomyces thermocoprophilus]